MSSHDRPGLPEALHPYTQPCTFPYLHGVYLAVNAVPDLFLLVDGPPCALTKAEQIFGSHDLGSTLLDVSGRSRVVATGVHVDGVVDGRDEGFVEAFRRLAGEPFVGAIAHACFPLKAVVGAPYDRLVRRADPAGLKPAIAIPARALAADWVQGYADTLTALAERLPLPEVATEPGRVAIIGYFQDRNEEDHAANLAELERLVGALGLELVATWLSGRGVAGLGEAARAGTLLALPGGEEAARALAARTGARVVATGLPFGFEATDRWLRALGEATGREERAAGAIEAARREHGRLVTRLSQRRFLDAEWAYAGHPMYLGGLAELAAFVGARLAWAVAWTSTLPPGVQDGLPVDVEVLSGLTAAAFEARVHAAVGQTDLLIGHHGALRLASDHALGGMEWGFPSWHHHALYAEPFLGWAGARCFLGRVADHLNDHDFAID